MSQTVETQFGPGTIVDREAVRGRVSYKVEGAGFSTWIEASAMPLDFQWMPGPDDIQDNSTTLPYNPTPQSWTNPTEQNIQPGQGIDPHKRTAPADSVDFQEDGESYTPGPDPRLFATGGLNPEDIQAKLGPKYVNAFQENDFTSLQARIEENPDLVMAEYREQVADIVANSDQDYLNHVGRNEYLEASDPQIREAAWKDVRAKAVRLRRSGQVNTRAASPDVIASQVTGDHGTYEVMVIRSNIFQGSSAVDSWSCECPWGQWAFKREHTFVGRLCSHAYATLMELQALVKTKNPSPVFRNSPGIGFDPSQLRNRRSSREAAGGDMDLEMFFSRYVDDGLDQFDDTSDQWSWIQENIDYEIVKGDINEAYDNDELSRGQSETLMHDLDSWRFSSRKAEIVDIRPVGWDPYARNLMNQLRDLWEEGSRPGREKERNEEVRELVQELRDRGYATDGIMASRTAAWQDHPSYTVDGAHDAKFMREGNAWAITFSRNSPSGSRWFWVIVDSDGNQRDHGGGFHNEDDAQSEAESVIGTYAKLSFLDRPMGYRDIPDYGTSEDYVLENELGNREDVMEPEFEYPAGGDHGIVHDINDGGRTADFQDDYVYGEPPGYGAEMEYDDPFYVDPMEREDYPEDDIVANFQRNAGHLLSDSPDLGGHDDISAAAQAHLRTAGRNFTMAEQQALIDEDDGQPYDRSRLDLRGTHYL